MFHIQQEPVASKGGGQIPYCFVIDNLKKVNHNKYICLKKVQTLYFFTFQLFWVKGGTGPLNAYGSRLPAVSHRRRLKRQEQKAVVSAVWVH